MADRPNILLLFSDEHNAAVSGRFGGGIAHTPHLDALAGRGIVFDAAYCNSPLCGPSRLSLTAGRYMSHIDAWGNGAALDPDLPTTLPRVLARAGYEPLLCGKQHYVAGHRYGFGEIGGDFNRYGRSTAVHRRRPADTSVDTAVRDDRFAEFRCGDRSYTLDHDRAVTAGAVEFLSRRKRGQAPFFLLVGWLAPHFPLTVPERYWRMYEGRVPDPQWPPGHLERQPLNYQHLRRGFGIVETDPAQVRLGRELYYGLTTWLDEQVGQVLAALDDSAVADDTIVIYASDHGENMGEHGLWWKCCMYDSAARVPLIVSWPKRWAGGQRRSQVCSLLDVVQTIGELAGADRPAEWSGRSLLPLLDSPQAAWENLAISEYYAHHIATGFVMLRDERYKYVYHAASADQPAERELYDMQADPQEFVNLADRPEHQARVAAMHRRLLAELGEEPEQTEARCPRTYARPQPPAPATKPRRPAVAAR